MKIDLDHLTIKAPLKPTRIMDNRDINPNARIFEDYRVNGLLDGFLVGHITISRGMNCTGIYDEFFLDISKNPPVPKPYVSYQETLEEFRGHGICGKIILLANEFYRGRLGTALYSDEHFMISFEKQSKRVCGRNYRNKDWPSLIHIFQDLEN